MWEWHQQRDRCKQGEVTTSFFEEAGSTTARGDRDDVGMVRDSRTAGRYRRSKVTQSTHQCLGGRCVLLQGAGGEPSSGKECGVAAATARWDVADGTKQYNRWQPTN